MNHLRKFRTTEEYKEYLNSDTQWRPLIAYVVNNHVENINPVNGKDMNMNVNDWYVGDDPLSQSDARFVDIHTYGDYFVEYFNNDTISFTNQVGTKGSFVADVDNAGVLRIDVPTSTHPEGGETWVDFDEETGTMYFWNYPESGGY